MLRVKRATGAKKAAGAPAEGFQPIHMAFAGILLLAMAYIGFDFYRLNAEQTRLTNEKASLEQEKERLKDIFKKKDDLQKRRELLDRKIAVIKELKAKQLGPVKLLDELSKDLPEYVWFQSVSETNVKDTFSIEGFALNANKVADFVENLQKSERFVVTEGPHYNNLSGQVAFRLTTVFMLTPTPTPGQAVTTAATGGAGK